MDIVHQFVEGETDVRHILSDGTDINIADLATAVSVAAESAQSSDSAITFSAAVDAAKAAATHVFAVQPTTPYVLDDIWDDGAGTIRRCTTARASGAFVTGDWSLFGLVADYMRANVALESPTITGGTMQTAASGNRAVMFEPTALFPAGFAIYHDPALGDMGLTLYVEVDAVTGDVQGVLGITDSGLSSVTSKITVKDSHTGVGLDGGHYFYAHDGGTGTGAIMRWHADPTGAYAFRGRLDVGGDIYAGNLDSGQTASLSLTTAYQNFSVSFNKTFAFVPHVVVTPRPGGGGGDIFCGVDSITTTGFVLRARRTASASIAFGWIAHV